MRKIKLSEKDLKDLYCLQKLSSRQIANKYSCGKTTILNLMKKSGIKARNKEETSRMIVHPVKYGLSKEELVDLYLNQQLSMGQIAKIYGTTSSIIHAKIRKCNISSRTFEEGNKLSIPRRSESIAKSVTKYKRNNFSGNDLEKSYLIGFRLGDLHIRKNKHGNTIYVSCKSTKMDQIELIKELFSKYGHIKVNGPYTGGYSIVCSLDLSFSFLIPKQDLVESWILNNKQDFVAFLAGYVDAEGHFGIDRNFGEFSIGSYDENIIKSIHKKLLDFGIEGRLPRIGQFKNHIDKRGVKNNGDLWTFKITRKNELLNFINLIENNIKHQKRYKDMAGVKTNILMRGLENNTEKR